MNPIYLAATGISVTGLGMIAAAHYIPSAPWLLIFGPLVVALGVVVGMVGGGVGNPWILIIAFFAIAVVLLLIDKYNILNLGTSSGLGG